MSLKKLKDEELLSKTKSLVQKERILLTEILHHLREVERRKLFSDVGYKSLFDYTVKDLGYSEGQAGRRIQAMRLLKELPQIEEKIAKGKLSLSNISQAQSYFRETNKNTKHEPISSEKKLELISSLENKSAREGQKMILSLKPVQPLPSERKRVISSTHTQVSFSMSKELEDKIQKLKSLLGPKAHTMNFAELFDCMADMSIQAAKEKRFGKKRVNSTSDSTPSNKNHKMKTKINNDTLEKATPTSNKRCSNNPRYISKAKKYQTWQKSGGKCSRCGSLSHLNIDHIKPVALGGGANKENLRLLCFNCNQRRAVKAFGARKLN